MITAAMLGPREFEAAVRLHQGRLQAYLYYLGCPRDDIADIVQESFLRLLNARRSDTSPAATAGWLRTTARHLLQAQHRSGTRARIELLGQGEAQLAALDRAWLAFEGDDCGDRYRAALRACMAELRAPARRALELRHGEQLSRREVARRLDRTESAVKILLERARKALRACVQRRTDR